MSPPAFVSRREFMAASAALCLSSADGVSDLTTPAVPLVGHTDTTSTVLWARFATAGTYRVTVRPAAGQGREVIATADATDATDLTARWEVRGLVPGSKYLMRIDGGDQGSFTTPPANDARARVTLAFGSCADEDEGTRAVWKRIAAEKPDAVILGGDTPYIDSTDLAIQRARHRAFAAVPEYQALLSTTPFWSTWDDHDFGKNDADGTLPGKENSRRAFMEYRPQIAYGDGSGGVYTSFRWGPVEVFVIDARWWSYTGQSFANPRLKTLLGQSQWEWLTTGLEASTAPFKVLTAGCIWESKKNTEKDHWETYVHERDALFAFIKERRIGGVVLFGGDIHVTRLLRYPVEHVGYPLYEFISSPMHARVIPSLNVPHPYLRQSKVQPHTFMTITVDTTVSPATLTARFLDVHGESLFADTVVTEREFTQRA